MNNLRTLTFLSIRLDTLVSSRNAPKKNKNKIKNHSIEEKKNAPQFIDVRAETAAEPRL